MSRVIDAIFRLTDEFSQPMKNCISSLTDAQSEGKKARKQLASVGKTISGVGTALTASITAPAVAAGTAAVQNYASVDKTLRLVQATMGSTEEQAATLSEAIKAAAADSVYSMQDAADASLNFARQGFSAEETANMIAPAMALAAGTETDLSETTGGLGNALKMFGMESTQASEACDVLAKAQAQANTTVSDLFEAMSTAGPICNTVGWTMKDLATITDVFGNAGISGSEGANALKTGLAKLAAPAKDGAAWIEKLGLDIFNSDGTLKSFAETQGQLNKAFQGLTDEEKMQAASAMFGKEQMAKWLTLIQASPEEVAQLSGALDECTGMAGDMSDALLSGTGGSIEKLKSSIDVLGYSMGEILSAYVQPFIDKITVWVDKLRTMDPEQQKMIVKFVAIAAAVGPCLIAFGKLVTGASSVFGALSKVRAAGGMVEAAIAAISAPAGIVVAALLAVVAIVAVVITHLDQFKAAIANMASQCSPGIEQLKSAFGTLTGTVGPILSQLSDLIATGLCGALEAMGPAANIVLEGIATAIGGLAQIIQGIVDTVKAIIDGDWSKAWDGAVSIVRGAVDLIAGLLEGVAGIAGGIADGIAGAYNAVTGKSSQKTKTAKNASGTNNWRGGLTSVNESGGEIINLPSGTQIIPHDLSRQRMGSQQNVSISGNYFTVREEADIDKITDALVRKLYKAQANMGMA